MQIADFPDSVNLELVVEAADEAHDEEHKKSDQELKSTLKTLNKKSNEKEPLIDFKSVEGKTLADGLKDDVTLKPALAPKQSSKGETSRTTVTSAESSSMRSTNIKNTTEISTARSTTDKKVIELSTLANTSK